MKVNENISSESVPADRLYELMYAGEFSADPGLKQKPRIVDAIQYPLLVHPDNLMWIIVGDREQIEKEIRGLNIGEVQLIDAAGNPVK